MAVMLMLIVLTLTNVQAQEAGPPPHLYYYSQLLGGLIIERADGTDSRQIAADVIPANMAGLAGAGWSPSGKYFAAYHRRSSYNVDTGSPYIINPQGETVFSGLSAISYVSRMDWSPTGEDILLIVSNNNVSISYWLIDVEQGVLLADFATRIELIGHNMSEVTWDVAHEQIVFSISSFLYPSNPTYRVTMHFDGTTLREPVKADEFQAMSDNVLMQSNDALRDGTATSPSGRYETRGYLPAVMTDTVTGYVVILPRHTQTTICLAYQWSADERYIMTFAGTLVA